MFKKSIVLGLMLAFSAAMAGADEPPTARQNRKGYEAVLKYIAGENISAESISLEDYHYYDGELSGLDYKVEYVKGKKYCTLEIRVEYDDRDTKHPATIDEDEVEEAACE